MADIIQLLPDAIANQIAAGEVIQRPASVVKELLENAIDAGSDQIKLILKDAGKLLVQVIDNGKGMSETDARMSFERHATSKIRKAEDLFVISTKGFRGEALASIAAIAQVELKTKQADDELGVRIVIEGSSIKKQELCQHQKGTSIAVKNLFYNVPARRKFLKTNAVELKHILEEFQRLALAHPDIFFSLFHNDNEVYHLPKENLRQRIVNIYGKNMNEKLVPVSEETDIMKISGYVGKPEYHKKTRGEQLFFVNDRFIKSPYLNHATMAAYEDLLPKGTYPFYAIFIEMNPDKIDVNVHPTKQEIKFEEERLVYNYVRVAVRHALGQYTMTPTLDFETAPGFSNAGAGSSDAAYYSKINAQEESNLANWKKLFDGVEEIEDNKQFNFESSLIGNDEDTIVKQPQQLHNSYIMSQIKSGLLIIDQQAAHERILFEKHLSMLAEQKASTQKALFPKTIELSNADSIIFQSMLESINHLGFDIQEFGSDSFIVHGKPAHIDPDANEEKLIKQLLDQYKMNLDLKLEATENIAQAFAVSASVKRGKSLSEEEMLDLINELFACEVPYKSPTSRKCFITIDLDELTKRFST